MYAHLSHILLFLYESIAPILISICCNLHILCFKSYIPSRTSSAPTYQLIQDGERPLLETLPMCYRRLRLPWPLNTSAWAPCSMRREKSLPTTCSALLDIELMPARSKHQLECLRISVFHPPSMGGIRGGDLLIVKNVAIKHREWRGISIAFSRDDKLKSFHSKLGTVEGLNFLIKGRLWWSSDLQEWTPACSDR